MPEKGTQPVLALHPDQIINLGFHRAGNEHTCIASTGNSGGDLVVHFKRRDESIFHLFDSHRISYYKSDDTIDACTNRKTLKFGLNFTTTDDHGEIKCSLTNTDDKMDLISEAHTLQLIPRKIS